MFNEIYEIKGKALMKLNLKKKFTKFYYWIIFQREALVSITLS
jgi:hypothetical protein